MECRILFVGEAAVSGSAALLLDSPMSAIDLEHSPKWSLGSELSFGPRLFFLIRETIPPVLGMQ